MFQVSEAKKWLKTYRELFGEEAKKVQTAHGLKKYYEKYVRKFTLPEISQSSSHIALSV